MWIIWIQLGWKLYLFHGVPVSPSRFDKGELMLLWRSWCVMSIFLMSFLSFRDTFVMCNKDKDDFNISPVSFDGLNQFSACHMEVFLRRFLVASADAANEKPSCLCPTFLLKHDLLNRTITGHCCSKRNLMLLESIFTTTFQRTSGPQGRGGWIQTRGSWLLFYNFLILFLFFLTLEWNWRTCTSADPLTHLLR